MNKNENGKEVRDLYDEVWSKIQNHDEAYAKKVLNNCLKKLDADRSEEHIFNSLKELFKKPVLWIGLISLLLVVPSLFAVFVWISLLIE